LRQADRARTDFAAIESDLEFIMDRLAKIPTRKELARSALGIIFGTAGLVIAGSSFSGTIACRLIYKNRPQFLKAGGSNSTPTPPAGTSPVPEPAG
jgi:hypothetical protein